MAGNKRKPWIDDKQPLPCVHAHKSADKDGKTRWRQDDGFRCKFPMPKIEYPNSLTRSFAWREPGTGEQGIWTFLPWCEGCPCYAWSFDTNIPEWRQFQYQSDAPVDNPAWYDFYSELDYLLQKERGVPMRRKPL